MYIAVSLYQVTDHLRTQAEPLYLLLDGLNRTPAYTRRLPPLPDF